MLPRYIRRRTHSLWSSVRFCATIMLSAMRSFILPVGFSFPVSAVCETVFRTTLRNAAKLVSPSCRMSRRTQIVLPASQGSFVPSMSICSIAGGLAKSSTPSP